MSDRVKIEILGSIIRDNNPPVKNVPVLTSYNMETGMYYYVVDTGHMRHLSVEDKTAMYFWLMRCARIATDKYGINVGVWRR